MLRAAMFGAWVTVGAGVGHVCGHGQLPPFIALAPVAAAASCVAWFLAARRIRWPEAAGLILVPQAVVHVLACYVLGHGIIPSTAMLAAHAVASAFTAWSAALGDWVWWLLWTWLTRHLTLLVLATRPGRGPVWVVRDHPTAARSHLLLAHVLVRRGPPPCWSW